MKKTSGVGEPPGQLDPNDVFAKVKENRGNSFEVEIPASHVPRLRQLLEDNEHAATLLVGIAPQLRSSFFVLRNSLVVVSLERIGAAGKIRGEITNAVADRREWQRSVPEWPAEWVEEQGAAGLDLPPSWSDEEYEDEAEPDVEDTAEGEDAAEAEDQ